MTTRPSNDSQYTFVEWEALNAEIAKLAEADNRHTNINK